METQVTYIRSRAERRRRLIEALRMFKKEREVVRHLYHANPGLRLKH